VATSATKGQIAPSIPNKLLQEIRKSAISQIRRYNSRLDMIYSSNNRGGLDLDLDLGHTPERAERAESQTANVLF